MKGKKRDENVERLQAAIDMAYAARWVTRRPDLTDEQKDTAVSALVETIDRMLSLVSRDVRAGG